MWCHKQWIRLQEKSSGLSNANIIIFQWLAHPPCTLWLLELNCDPFSAYPFTWGPHSRLIIAPTQDGTESSSFPSFFSYFLLFFFFFLDFLFGFFWGATCLSKMFLVNDNPAAPPKPPPPSTLPTRSLITWEMIGSNNDTSLWSWALSCFSLTHVSSWQLLFRLQVQDGASPILIPNHLSWRSWCCPLQDSKRSTRDQKCFLRLFAPDSGSKGLSVWPATGVGENALEPAS